jgi:hypothetical protein
MKDRKEVSGRLIALSGHAERRTRCPFFGSGRPFYDDTPYTVAASASGTMRAIPSMISAASDGAKT